MRKLLECLKWSDLVSLSSRACPHEMRARECYIECVEWGEILTKVKNLLRGKFEKLSENKSEVSWCISCWFKGCFWCVLDKESGVEKAWTSWHVRESGVSKFVHFFYILLLAKCMVHGHAWNASCLGFLGKERNNACDGDGELVCTFEANCVEEVDAWPR